MRNRLRPIALCLLFYAPNVSALKPASSGDFQEIQKAIAAGNLEQQKLQRLHLSLQNKGFKREEGWKGASPKELEAIRVVERDRNLAFDRAIRKALTAYDIVPSQASGRPDMPSGEIVIVGPTYSRRVSWIVVAGENEKRQVISTAGSLKWVNPVKGVAGHKPAGVTATDGVSVIFPEAFSTPGKLALYLYHEKEHFSQYTTRGYGDELTGSQREVFAWKAAMNNTDLLGFSASEKVAVDSAVKDIVEKYQKKSLWEAFKSEVSLGLVRSPSDDLELPNAPRGFEERQKRFDELDAIFSQELAEVRQRKEEMARKREAERREREERDEQSRAIPVPTLSALDIKWLVQRACAGGAAVEEFGANIWNPTTDGYTSRMGDDLTGCSGEMWALIMRNRGEDIVAFSVPDFNRVAKAYARWYSTPPLAAAEDLAAFAKKACGAGVSKADLRSIDWFPNPNVEYAGNGRRGLSGCARDLFEDLLGYCQAWGAGSTLNIDWVNFRARELAKRHAPPPQQAPPSNSGQGQNSGASQGWRPPASHPVPTLPDILRRLR